MRNRAAFLLLCMVASGTAEAADPINPISPCLAVGRARLDMTYNRIGADMKEHAYPMIMAKMEECLQANEVCIAGEGYFGKPGSEHAEYKYQSAKSLKDKVNNSRRSGYGTVVVFVQFKDASVPEGVCLFALNTGPNASPFRYHAWHIESGQPIWVDGLQGNSSIYDSTNGDTSQMLVQNLVGDYRATIQKKAKEAQQSNTKK